MSCLLKYRWVKLPRALVPSGKGVLGSWARLAARSAFRAGTGRYCGHLNAVTPGMWSGGIVGVKSILGVRRRGDALRILDELQTLGYITYTLDPATKKLEYRIRDWVLECSGEGCSDSAVYATACYGFICLPRNITQRLADRKIKFGDADAWLDLWCHTVWRENSNAFSYMAPTVQFGTMGAALTLEALGRRWGWEKTKVWRFLRKYPPVRQSGQEHLCEPGNLATRRDFRNIMVLPSQTVRHGNARRGLHLYEPAKAPGRGFVLEHVL